MSLQQLVGFTLLCFSASFVGCGKPQGIEVKGAVSLDGRPLSGAQVKLLSQGASGQTLHTAATDLQGNFLIKNSGDAKTAILPGKYIVLISKVTGGMGSAVNEVPEKYNDVNQTPLKIEITENQGDLPPFELKSKP